MFCITQLYTLHMPRQGYLFVATKQTAHTLPHRGSDNKMIYANWIAPTGQNTFYHFFSTNR